MPRRAPPNDRSTGAAPEDEAAAEERDGRDRGPPFMLEA